MGFDNSFDLERWQDNFELEITSLSAEEIVFEMKGVDAPIANALRRILISEVPTMAIEKVFINNNTSIIPDEVLAHRLGLIPIAADPRKFHMRVPDSGTKVTTPHAYCRIRNIAAWSRLIFTFDCPHASYCLRSCANHYDVCPPIINAFAISSVSSMITS